MYERHFGITGPPFQLSPDPAFYFDASQHHAALSALRGALAAERPITVLSGDIGAGKTTVLRAWLAEVEAAGIAVAQLVNTQLEADELLVAIATAFGVDANPARNRTPIAALRWFLRGLDGRAAVLAIDEAQNLGRAALNSLVDLTRAAKDANAQLRIVLAGQPELRTHVTDATLPALQAQVPRACHLGPLDPSPTQQYIEHRLRKVGWTGTPSFEARAFDEIHSLTGGVPRRINVLANRLLLGQYLNDTAHIDRKTVSDVAQALDVEIGSGAVTHDSPRHAPQRDAKTPAHGALLLLASGRSDCVKAMALMAATDARDDLPPTRIVILSENVPWHLNHDVERQLGWTDRLVSLADDLPGGPGAAEERFARLIELQRPAAVLVFDADPLSHRCAEVAHRHAVPLVHVGTDPQAVDEQATLGGTRSLIGRLAGLRFECQPSKATEQAARAPHAQTVGNLLIDALRLAQKVASRESPGAAPPVANGVQVDARRGYGIVALKTPPAGAHTPCRPELLPFLRMVSRDLPLVWPMQQATMLVARSCGLARTFEGDRIARIEEMSHVDFVRLMRDATCVLTDSPDVMEEAAALRLPCLGLDPGHAHHVGAGNWLPVTEVGHDARLATQAIWRILFGGTRHAALPALWDGSAGARIAGHLAAWLPRRPVAVEPVRRISPAAEAVGSKHGT